GRFRPPCCGNGCRRRSHWWPCASRSSTTNTTQRPFLRYSSVSSALWSSAKPRSAPPVSQSRLSPVSSIRNHWRGGLLHPLRPHSYAHDHDISQPYHFRRLHERHARDARRGRLPGRHPPPPSRPLTFPRPPRPP